MTSRPASHSGSWYSASPPALTRQLAQFFASLPSVKGARVLIGPHAGFTFSGQRLAETFATWDPTNCQRIFILGPSHHIYFRNYAMITDYESYDTPLGPVPVDTDVCNALESSLFRVMSEEADEDEHSFEMHCPFIRYRLDQRTSSLASQGAIQPKIVPIMISSMDSKTSDAIVKTLLPYFKDPQNTFVISSDFCHWGSRFGYTEYVAQKVDLTSPVDLNTLELKTLTSFLKLKDNAIYESIEILDRIAMNIASNGSYKDWEHYIKTTGNTICGQKPVLLVMKLLLAAHSKGGFNWLGYSQSSAVENYFESSVSYASGYVVPD